MDGRLDSKWYSEGDLIPPRKLPQAALECTMVIILKGRAVIRIERKQVRILANKKDVY